MQPSKQTQLALGMQVSESHERVGSPHIAKVRFADCYSIYTGHLHTQCSQC